MSTNCERRRDLGAVQLAEATSSYSTSAVSCCAHSEQLNTSRSQPGVPVRAMSYSRIARPQLGHAGVLPTGCSGDLNKLNWGITPLLALPTNSQQRNLFRDWFCHSLREQLAGAHVRFGSKADMCGALGDVRFVHPASRSAAVRSFATFGSQMRLTLQWSKILQYIYTLGSGVLR
jgi:hypothetical protein